MFRKTETKFYLSEEITRQNGQAVKPTQLRIPSDQDQKMARKQQQQQFLTPQELPSHTPGAMFGGAKEKRRCLCRLFRHKTQPELPLNRSIEVEKNIIKYANSEWATEKPMAMRMKKGYTEVSKQYECIRRIRGDNYCAMRSVLFQILTTCDINKCILTQFPTMDSAFKRLEVLRGEFGELVGNWSFGQNERLRESSNLKDCIKTFYQLIGDLKNETNPKRRDRVVAELNSNNAGYFEKDARLMEFVKFLMFSKAACLYEQLREGREIPNWFLFLTLRDNSSSLEDFFHFHLNLVGDSLGLEQIEMFLLGVALNVRIQAFRLKSVDEQDFVTHYPSKDDTSLPLDAPSVSLIAEDDRHYNVVYSLK